MPSRSSTISLSAGLAALALLAGGIANVLPLGRALFVSPLSAVIAIITGGIGLATARGSRRGQGLAIAGLVLGILALVAFVVLLVAFTVFVAALQHGD